MTEHSSFKAEGGPLAGRVYAFDKRSSGEVRLTTDDGHAVIYRFGANYAGSDQRSLDFIGILPDE